MKIVRIEKAYSRKIVRPSDYSSYMFETRLVADVEVKKPEDLQSESDKLFDCCKNLTLMDIEKNWEEITGEKK